MEKERLESPAGCLMFGKIPQSICPPRPNVRNDPNQQLYYSAKIPVCQLRRDRRLGENYEIW